MSHIASGPENEVSLPSADTGAPLAGITVLDFSRFLPGQLCTSVLADFGARVIRIENPRDIAKISSALGWDRLDQAERERIRAVDSLARNKQSVIVDIGHPDAADVLPPLIRLSSVIVEDYRPGMLDKLGWGYHDVEKLNRSINYCSLSFAGQSGPYRNKPGHDQIALALTGLLARVGEDPGKPSLPNIPLADVTCGLQGVIGILLATMATRQTGLGQQVDVSITESLMPFLAWLVSRLATGAKVASRDAPRIDVGIWRTSDHAFLCLTNMEPRFWERFCTAIGREDFAARQYDEAGYPAMRTAIEDIIGSRPIAAWLRIFQEHDVQAAPVNDISAALNDPHLRDREMIVEREAGGRTVPAIAPGVRLSRTPPRFRGLGEMPGSSTHAVLQELGLGDERIAALQASGCIGKNRS